MPARIERVEVLQPGPWLAVGPIRRAEWIRLTLTSPLAPPEGLRVVQLSDLHLQHRAPPVVWRIIERLEADPPAAVLFTGDFVDDKLAPQGAFDDLARILLRLPSRLGTFGILGNHDGDLLAAHLGAMNVLCLEGRRLRVGEGASAFDLVGLGGVTREETVQTLELDRDPQVLTLALSHYPDAIRRCGRLRPDILLAGHTHGGQVCLPAGRALITHDSLPRSMVCGAWQTENGVLVVSRGLGHTGLPIRLFAPAQVVELIIEPGP